MAKKSVDCSFIVWDCVFHSANLLIAVFIITEMEAISITIDGLMLLMNLIYWLHNGRNSKSCIENTNKPRKLFHWSYLCCLVLSLLSSAKLIIWQLYWRDYDRLLHCIVTVVMVSI